MTRSGDRLRADAIAVAGLPARVVARCGSTNTALLEETHPGPLLLAAEAQTAGRGRRGRRWRSAPGAGATFSILRRMRCAPAALSGLSLAVGVAAARALRALGAVATQVKWPNDLVVGEAKLGGILIETRISAGET
ncbi:MAG: biotin--[acetyl-CoA-carboxylase] ligase, partial [Betaproteobacteria bacterium]|nr:biotin--[acetyl-CoA-carboxylase] ligase [Betaproteobacteria bacterium]